MIGEMFRAQRERLSMTQTETAQRLFVSQPFLAQVECGAKMPTVVMLKMASELFGCTTDALIFGDQNVSKACPLGAAVKQA